MAVLHFGLCVRLSGRCQVHGTLIEKWGELFKQTDEVLPTLVSVLYTFNLTLINNSTTSAEF